MLLSLAPRQPLSEQSHPAGSQPYLGSPAGARLVWALPDPSSLQGTPWGSRTSSVPPSSPAQPCWRWTREGERGLRLSVCGPVPLGTAGVTWTQALPNTYTRADTDSSTHTNQHPPTSIHQILTQHKHTHTHAHTHTQADASSKANSIILAFHPEANGQAGILLPCCYYDRP